MSFIQEMIVKFRDMIKPNEKGTYHPEATRKEDTSQLMSDDEKLDEAIEESFPASDPPGHISKSAEDLRQY
ncbi:hypothetical protein [Peredibacter starrii]|uniref:Uncharacterized protein n=1 Tax=Peredibacter starrii TaxID=28202 RepID=A0AAX4HKW2_9BACT|nr:hypothetical protein [Peredibacter starrii]WPU63861.1 hypothetical protein SOO65_14290 [Peredibacter starrii]